MKVLIVGAGPSLERNIQEWNNDPISDGWIFATDKALIPLLKAGIIPDYVATYEVLTAMGKYFQHDLVTEHGHKIQGFVNNGTPQSVKQLMHDTGISIEDVYPKSDDTIANVGLFSILVAIEKLRATEIYMIGMDTCCGEEEIKVPRKHILFENIYYSIVNPHTENENILNPIHLLWREEFMRERSNHPEVKFTNLTGDGTLFGDNIIWKSLKSL